MKKKIVFSTLVLSLGLISGCSQEKKELFLDGKREELIEVYQFEDGRKLYSQFSDNQYQKKDGTLISLTEAMNANLVDVTKIQEEMMHLDDLNDGGSSIYEYHTEDSAFSNSDFYLINCHTLSGNRNHIIAYESDAVRYCSLAVEDYD